MNAAAELQIENTMLRRELQCARLKIEALKEELRRERIGKYGPQSENLSNLQLELLEEEPGVSDEEVQAESQREPLPASETRHRKPHPGRQRLPEKLPRVEEVIPCAERSCRQCGAETAVIGYDESEVLDVEPARYLFVWCGARSVPAEAAMCDPSQCLKLHRGLWRRASPATR